MIALILLTVFNQGVYQMDIVQDDCGNYWLTDHENVAWNVNPDGSLRLTSKPFTEEEMEAWGELDLFDKGE